MRSDLSVDLGSRFKGEFLNRYVPVTPRTRMPVFHSVGAGDPLEDADVRTRIDDGLPNTLAEWIAHDGLISFKIKLNGGDIAADLMRVGGIEWVGEWARAGGRTARSMSGMAARMYVLFPGGQDAHCPCASLIQPAAITALVPGNAGIEANARQFVPSANRGWDERFPGLFTIHDGMMNTGQLRGPGL